MNYSEELKKKETNLINMRAQALAKKKNIEDALEKRKKAEELVNEKFSIALADVPSKIEELKNQLESGYKKIAEEVEDIEIEFSKIK